jgi:hypothetical protein
MTAYDNPLRTPHAPPAGAANSTGRRGGVRADAERPNVVRTNLAQQSVNGVLATGTQHSETIPVGAIGNARAIQTSSVSWVSSELKVPVQIRRSDPRFGNTDMELTNIVQSEPSASLFVVPAGYTVKTNGQGGMRGAMRGPRPGLQSQQ